MKAIRLIEHNSPLQMQDVPMPAMSENDVLIRIRAAGICHSDVHYRAGRPSVLKLPVTPGHEIAGEVEQIGKNVSTVKVGDRVCIHYVLSCGDCYHCSTGNEQFCIQGGMLGNSSDGGYAEYIAVPERNAVYLPDEVSFENGAVLMCSSATSFHVLRRSRLRAGETVAVFGVGGLGLSAIQLAYSFGALDVYAIDINPDKLKLAEKFRAIPLNAQSTDPVDEIRKHTRGRGIDVALELIGLPQTVKQAVQSMAVMGRVVVAGIGDKPLEIDTYRELLSKEVEIIGSNDHLLQELPLLLELARRGQLDLSEIVTGSVPLNADAINQVLDNLEGYGGGLRTVIVP